jgi:hypothetical protein
MQTVALYSDYKDLYQKVMPSLDNVQKHMMIVADEHAQNKEMLINLD